METNPVIFYDGVCGLCNRTVQFVIRHDVRKKFRYATLQSEYARKQLGDSIGMDSFICYHKGRVRGLSTGALYVAKQLGGWWSVLYVFILIPPFIRDGIYKWVAKNRYQWFGKLPACPVPTPEQRSLFLDHISNTLQ